ncbi:MAG: Gx transporter family protein [Lachnospiraceae bacterium]|nr:Gx transporter family protein [Lachnospiraceae bacterium]
MKTSRMTHLALLTAMALILTLVESALPPLAPIPGIKLGLANIITLIALYFMTPADAFVIMLVRILLASLFAGQAMSMMYSFAGGLFCFAAMLLTKKLLSERFIILTSMVGAIFHNVGQILIAYLLTKTTGIFLYFPILLLSGLITGLFTGLCAFYASKPLRRIPSHHPHDFKK